MKRPPLPLSRRQVVLTTGVAGAVLATSSVPRAGAVGATKTGESQPMKNATFVLVHGAWHGGWCWKKVVPLLRDAGHQVFTPTLTGLGERVHQLSAEVDLTTHIDDVLGVLEYEDLRDVVLVGHSYGGMVISGVAERAHERLAGLVYLDAFFPEDGKSINDYTPADFLAVLDDMVNTRGDGWRLPSFMFAKEFGVTDPADVAWVDARLGDQPYKTLTQPLDLTADVQGGIRRAYIATTQDTFIPHAARAREDGLIYEELISAGHDSMITQPAELTELLLKQVP